ncbi:MAG: FHA domain-containing protein [Spirochaetes bacterium]|nr:FHA domain-containing protein [Spirochaetota bacterium]
MSKKSNLFDDKTFINASGDLVVEKEASIIVKGTPLLEVRGNRKVLSIKGFGLGRHKSNGVIIADPSVSKFHAMITFKKGKGIIKDSGSSNGTFLNGERLIKDKEYSLTNEAVILLGKTRIIYLCEY